MRLISAALVLPVLVITGCGGTTMARSEADSGPDDAAGRDGSVVGVGAVCSQDGMPTAACDPGLACPTPAHGHDTSCCANPSTACHQDGDCCTGVCLTASGTCAAAKAPGALCTKGSDCINGVCDSMGECGALDAGATCGAQSECASDLCEHGVCVCWPTGTPFPDDASVENCCSQSEGLLPDGGQGCG
jgi:hypothetical protein